MKIIEKFQPMGGHHCITNSLKQIFNYYQYDISEEMLFGLGEGISFVYVNLADAPMISGRIKAFEFEKKIGGYLNIDIKVKSTKNNNIAVDKLKNLIDKNYPVMLYVDMAYLKYLNMKENSHFGGHSIVVFGYDDKDEVFYVSDRDSNEWKIHTPEGEVGRDYHLLSYKDMITARSSSFRPFPPNNRWLEFNFKNVISIDGHLIRKAIINNLTEIINPPANLLGINGMRKFSKEIKKWKNFDEEKLRITGITNYFMINKNGGTGGGAFRKIYGNFLIEASEYLPELKSYGNDFLKISDRWEEIALNMMKLYETGNLELLSKMSDIINSIASDEENTIKGILTVLG